MSVINSIPLIAAGDDGYKISRSVRLRSSASAYFNRTPASAGNRKTWTWSSWVKRGSLGGTQALFDSTWAANNNSWVSIRIASDTLYMDTYSESVQTTAVFRDPSAWYHVVYAVDTTQSTSTNRIKIFVNGVQQTISGTYPALNADLGVNTTNPHSIGRYNWGSSLYFDGYLTEINFIDGQALTPSSFGETNSVTGVWQPKKYGGTYGTNGFYLNFSDNSAATATTIGKDYSGNGNNWTPNNISVTAGVTYDSMLDVPTLYADGGNGRGNYAVMNPLSVVSPTTIANGNLDVTTGTTGGGGAFSTIAIPTSGKYYFEFLPTSATTVADNIRVGVSNSTVGSYVLYKSDGNKVVDGSTTSYGATFTTNDTIGCAVDVDGGTITFYKNNSSQGSITYATSSGNFFAYTQDGSGTVSVVASFNFGQRPFSYTPPTGFVALNTQNLPAPTISNGAGYMAATLYTGNATARTIANTVNGISFQPDLVWLKMRSSGSYLNHHLVDSVRGDGKVLYSNLTNAEDNLGSTVIYTTSTGFGLSAGVGVNENSQTFVGWQWNAGGSTVTNTSGSITSTVSANTTAGFSIVTYTANNTAGATIGHGLGVAPSFIIVKSRSAVNSWNCYHTSLGNTKGIDLNGTGAASTNSLYWNNTSPTSSVFSVSTFTNNSTSTYVAYCFSAVAGYSAFGSYTGNGSTDGPFVFLGFRPRFVIIRRTDAGNNWHSYTSTIDPSNVVAKTLYPNTSGTEGTENDLDFVSNGMKMRDTGTHTNASGGTYIYMAWAENPFQNSLAR